MTVHSDPELLAMMALDEPDIPANAIAHVASCPECREELVSLRRVATLARSGSPIDDQLEQPNPAVWNRISETLGIDPGVRATTAADASTVGGGVASSPASARRSDPHVPRHSRASRRIIAGAIAVVVAAGAALAVVAVVRSTLPDPTTITTQATLKALPRWSGSRGVALVEKVPGGGREVVVSMTMSRGASGYREVWLISPDLKKLISIGVLSGQRGRFMLPADVKLKDYPIVDISEEQLDGNPAHSGNSIVRGMLLGKDGSLT